MNVLEVKIAKAKLPIYRCRFRVREFTTSNRESCQSDTVSYNREPLLRQLQKDDRVTWRAHDADLYRFSNQIKFIRIVVDY